jgi:hypothetical protein
MHQSQFRERRMRMNRKHHEADSQNENDSGNFEEVLSHYTEKLKESDPA